METNIFRDFVRKQMECMSASQRVGHVADFLRQTHDAADDGRSVATFEWFYETIKENSFAHDADNDGQLSHCLQKVWEQHLAFRPRQSSDPRFPETQKAIVRAIGEYFHAGDRQHHIDAFDCLIAAGWSPEKNPPEGLPAALRDVAGRLNSDDDRKVIIELIKTEIDDKFSPRDIEKLVVRTARYLPDALRGPILNPYCKKGGSEILIEIARNADFARRVGLASLSPESIDLLTKLSKNQCPFLDAAVAGLRKRLIGGTDGMEADTWADGARVYGKLSFVYSFNPPNMITVDVTPLWECDPVENFTQIMMDRIRQHVSDFQKDEGRQISVSACILDREGANGFIRFFKATYGSWIGSVSRRGEDFLPRLFIARRRFLR